MDFGFETFRIRIKVSDPQEYCLFLQAHARDGDLAAPHGGTPAPVHEGQGDLQAPAHFLSPRRQEDSGTLSTFLAYTAKKFGFTYF
jgi:hypothetical protein